MALFPKRPKKMGCEIVKGRFEANNLDLEEAMINNKIARVSLIKLQDTEISTSPPFQVQATLPSNQDAMAPNSNQQLVQPVKRKRGRPKRIRKGPQITNVTLGLSGGMTKIKLKFLVSPPNASHRYSVVDRSTIAENNTEKNDQTQDPSQGETESYQQSLGNCLISTNEDKCGPTTSSRTDDVDSNALDLSPTATQVKTKRTLSSSNRRQPKKVKTYVTKREHLRSASVPLADTARVQDDEQLQLLNRFDCPYYISISEQTKMLRAKKSFADPEIPPNNELSSAAKIGSDVPGSLLGLSPDVSVSNPNRVRKVKISPISKPLIGRVRRKKRKNLSLPLKSILKKPVNLEEAVVSVQVSSRQTSDFNNPDSSQIGENQSQNSSDKPLVMELGGHCDFPSEIANTVDLPIPKPIATKVVKSRRTAVKNHVNQPPPLRSTRRAVRKSDDLVGHSYFSLAPPLAHEATPSSVSKSRSKKSKAKSPKSNKISSPVTELQGAEQQPALPFIVLESSPIQELAAKEGCTVDLNNVDFNENLTLVTVKKKSLRPKPKKTARRNKLKKTSVKGLKSPQANDLTLAPVCNAPIEQIQEFHNESQSVCIEEVLSVPIERSSPEITFNCKPKKRVRNKRVVPKTNIRCLRSYRSPPFTQTTCLPTSDLTPEPVLNGPIDIDQEVPENDSQNGSNSNQSLTCSLPLHLVEKLTVPEISKIFCSAESLTNPNIDNDQLSIDKEVFSNSIKLSSPFNEMPQPKRRVRRNRFCWGTRSMINLRRLRSYRSPLYTRTPSPEPTPIVPVVNVPAQTNTRTDDRSLTCSLPLKLIEELPNGKCLISESALTATDQSATVIKKAHEISDSEDLSNPSTQTFSLQVPDLLPLVVLESSPVQDLAVKEGCTLNLSDVDDNSPFVNPSISSEHAGTKPKKAKKLDTHERSEIENQSGPSIVETQTLQVPQLLPLVVLESSPAQDLAVKEGCTLNLSDDVKPPISPLSIKPKEKVRRCSKVRRRSSFKSPKSNEEPMTIEPDAHHCNTETVVNSLTCSLPIDLIGKLPNGKVLRSIRKPVIESVLDGKSQEADLPVENSKVCEFSIPKPTHRVEIKRSSISEKPDSNRMIKKMRLTLERLLSGPASPEHEHGQNGPKRLSIESQGTAVKSLICNLPLKLINLQNGKRPLSIPEAANNSIQADFRVDSDMLSPQSEGDRVDKVPERVLVCGTPTQATETDLDSRTDSSTNEVVTKIRVDEAAPTVSALETFKSPQSKEHDSSNESDLGQVLSKFVGEALSDDHPLELSSNSINAISQVPMIDETDGSILPIIELGCSPIRDVSGTKEVDGENSSFFCKLPADLLQNKTQVMELDKNREKSAGLIQVPLICRLPMPGKDLSLLLKSNGVRQRRKESKRRRSTKSRSVTQAEAEFIQSRVVPLVTLDASPIKEIAAREGCSIRNIDCPQEVVTGEDPLPEESASDNILLLHSSPIKELDENENYDGKTQPLGFDSLLSDGEIVDDFDCGYSLINSPSPDWEVIENVNDKVWVEKLLPLDEIDRITDWRYPMLPPRDSRFAPNSAFYQSSPERVNKFSTNTEALGSLAFSPINTLSPDWEKIENPYPIEAEQGPSQELDYSVVTTPSDWDDWDTTRSDDSQSDSIDKESIVSKEPEKIFSDKESIEKKLTLFNKSTPNQVLKVSVKPIKPSECDHLLAKFAGGAALKQSDHFDSSTLTSRSSSPDWDKIRPEYSPIVSTTSTGHSSKPQGVAISFGEGGEARTNCSKRSSIDMLSQWEYSERNLIDWEEVIDNHDETTDGDSNECPMSPTHSDGSKWIINGDKWFPPPVNEEFENSSTKLEISQCSTTVGDSVITVMDSDDLALDQDKELGQIEEISNDECDNYASSFSSSVDFKSMDINDLTELRNNLDKYINKVKTRHNDSDDVPSYCSKQLLPDDEKEQEGMISIPQEDFLVFVQKVSLPQAWYTTIALNVQRHWSVTVSSGLLGAKKRDIVFTLNTGTYTILLNSMKVALLGSPRNLSSLSDIQNLIDVVSSVKDEDFLILSALNK